MAGLSRFVSGYFDHYMPLAHREVLEECGGLLPGVWVDRADEFDDELRDITLRSASFDEWYCNVWILHKIASV